MIFTINFSLSFIFFTLGNTMFDEFQLFIRNSYVVRAAFDPSFFNEKQECPPFYPGKRCYIYLFDINKNIIGVSPILLMLK
jgi:hypothetical protein